MIGFRNESLYGSGINTLEDVVTFEITELGNLDIPCTLLDTWKLTSTEHKYLSQMIESAENTYMDNLDVLADYCMQIIKKYYPLARYCLWLGSKQAIQRNYEGTPENIDAYKIEILLPISDLGFEEDGCLFIFTKKPIPIKTESSKKVMHTYEISGKVEFYNRNSGRMDDRSFMPIIVKAVSEAQALSRAKFRLRNKFKLAKDTKMTLYDYVVDVSYNSEEPVIDTELATCDICGTRLTDAGECPKCDLLDNRFDENLKLYIKESNDYHHSSTRPGDLYNFLSNLDFKNTFWVDHSKTLKCSAVDDFFGDTLLHCKELFSKYITVTVYTADEALEFLLADSTDAHNINNLVRAFPAYNICTAIEAYNGTLRFLCAKGTFTVDFENVEIIDKAVSQTTITDTEPHAYAKLVDRT